MSDRLSIGNFLLPISFKQFQTMVREFQDACARGFGTECEVRLRALARLKVSSTFLHDDDTMQYMDDLNKRATFFETTNANEFTREIFRKARYIEVLVHPHDKTKAPQSAFGCIEFKGKLSHRATFYIQCAPEDALVQLKKAHPFNWKGDGYKFHCDIG